MVKTFGGQLSILQSICLTVVEPASNLLRKNIKTKVLEEEEMPGASGK
mgnify:CR=1 FL=1